MDLIALAVPLFLIALLVELAVDRVRGTGHYRTNDAINSLSAGTLSTTFGYFTRFLPAVIWAFVLQNFALIEVELAWFDLSPRGIALWLLAILAFDFCYYWSHGNNGHHAKCDHRHASLAHGRGSNPCLHNGVGGDIADRAEFIWRNSARPALTAKPATQAIHPDRGCATNFA